jgi:hypothetical protein
MINGICIGETVGHRLGLQLNRIFFSTFKLDLQQEAFSPIFAVELKIKFVISE